MTIYDTRTESQQETKVAVYPAATNKTMEAEGTVGGLEALQVPRPGYRRQTYSPHFEAGYRENPLAAYVPGHPDERDGFLRRSYGSHYDDIERRLSQLGSNASALLGDPGVVQHLSELEWFMEDRPETSKYDPRELRKSFAEFLGNETVYRGLSLTAEQFDEWEASEKGLAPRKGPEIVDRARADFQSILINHANPVHPETGSVQSVSRFPDNALSMGSGIAPEGETKVYLFSIELPRLDLVDFNGAPFNWSRFSQELREGAEAMRLDASFVESIDYGPHKVLGLISPTGKLYYRSVEHGSEQFVFGDIPRSAIKAVQLIPTDLHPKGTQPCWNSIDQVDTNRISDQTIPDWLAPLLSRYPDASGQQSGKS